MQLLDQHAKSIMEQCKVRARDAGLTFDNETLEFIVTNRDMVDLKARVFIPTLYDYWVHDVETLQERGRYDVFPHNPFETVVNTRPAMSYYNDNNPDWLNVMIFYHVLGHVDFFQNNAMFRNTWGDDFAAQALANKRIIAGLRSKHGRWVDYVIEFSRGIDNLVGYFETLSKRTDEPQASKTDFFFDTFLQEIKKVPQSEYLRFLDIYNANMSAGGGELGFFQEVVFKYPELDAEFEKYKEQKQARPTDPIEFILQNSPFLNTKENEWMKQVVEIVRNTSLYFSPQMRSKIFNEGWASFWHDRLFLTDERVSGNEVVYARINAQVTALSRVGVNPYAVGLRLLTHIEDMADQGKLSYDFQRMQSIEARQKYDLQTGNGTKLLLTLREELNDFTLINAFVDQEFVDRYKLFVAGRRFNQQEWKWEYYIKSRKAEDYKQMLIDGLYHPPFVTVEAASTKDRLCLEHHFEGKRLVAEFIPSTMIGLEYLWGGPVQLKTHENEIQGTQEVWQPVQYTAKDKKVLRQALKTASP